MATTRDDKEFFRCIFCEKSKKDGLRLIGGHGIYVCEECVRNSYALLKKISEEDERKAVKQIPKPSEIKKVLDELGYEFCRLFAAKGIWPDKASKTQEAKIALTKRKAA